MPKHGFLTPKAISNRIKAKGLQKLKWYCQMCEKQCRDENGFKCHKLSESHQRKMKLFIAAPKKFMNDFSREFDKRFMQILRLKGGRRVKANEVYTDYIADRQHIHMNATVWSTLTGYVLYLGKTGKAKVERADNESNDRGATWYITYIERDPEILNKQQQIKKMQKVEKKERKYEQQRIQQMIEKNKQLNKLRGNDYQITELNKDNNTKIAFGFKPKIEIINEENENDNYNQHEDIDIDNNNCENTNNSDDKNVNKKINKKRKLSNLEALIEENENKKRKLNDNGYDNIWLIKGIIVKVNCGDYKGKKGVVLDVMNKDNKIKGIIKLLKCKEDIELKIKDKYLETVIPKFGRNVKILCGKYMNCIGVLQSINENKYCGNIELRLDDKNSKIVPIPYEHFSKLA
eukprot:33235_1